MGLMMLGQVTLVITFGRRITVVVNRRLQNDGPSWGEEGVMNIKIIGLERESGKDRRNGDDLTVGEMMKGRCHGAWSNSR